MSTPQPCAGTNRPDPAATASATTPATSPADASPDVGPETWVREAIAEQEEYIKRWHSCMDMLGRSHAYGDVATIASAAGSGAVTTCRACTVCGVTQTREDYRIQQAAAHRPGSA